jgi:3-phenylpropionate/trans-cinnamate dioxygenase ferredoxin reductase subunit
MTEQILIVGAGQAGAWAALTLRQSGFAGRILLLGEESERPYERPPLSKAALTAEPEPPPTYFHAATRYADEKIEFLPMTRAEKIDRAAHRLHLADGATLPYDKLLLTTGASARSLPIQGGEHALLLRTLADAHRIRTALGAAREIICIGAGIIGLEVAAAAHQRGCAVTVLEAAPGAMARALAPEAARYMENLHHAAGILLRFNQKISAIEPATTGAFIVHRADAPALHTDLVLAGIGILRNTELASEAGIAVENGILVDEYGHTSDPDIFAAGDVAAFHHPFFNRRLRIEAWRHAQDHGIAVARVMCGSEKPYDEIPWFWTDQLGINLQIAGLPAEAARTIIRPGSNFTAIHLDAEGIVIGITAANNAREVRAGTALIKTRARPDPTALADPAVPLQSLR